MCGRCVTPSPSLPSSHKLSATHLLASPDGSRHPLDNPAAGMFFFLIKKQNEKKNTTLTPICSFKLKFALNPCQIIIIYKCAWIRVPTTTTIATPISPNRWADISQFDGSFSRLAGYESSLDGTSLWNRRGFSTSSRFSILDCFFACQKRIKQYIAKRKVITSI